MEHGLAPSDLKLFSDACATDAKIKRAWLARKKTKHFPDRPLLVLILDYGYFGRAKQEQLQAIVDATPQFDRLVLVSKEAKSVAGKIERLNGALIYVRP